jgi:cell division transport system permease protein
LIWRYAIKEGFDGLRRAKMAALVAVLTMAGALLVAGVFMLVTLNLSSIVDKLRGRIEMEVFVDNSRDDVAIQSLRKQVEKITGVAAARYVSREEAVEIYRQEFGNGILDLLNSNPLPPSFRLTLQKPYQYSDAAQRIATQIHLLEGVDEVVYRRDFLLVIDRYISFALALDFLIGLIVFLGVIFVVVNHVRLVAFAKRRIIETMQLVGATSGFVRTPFLLQGFFHGIFGAALGCAFFYLSEQVLLVQYRDLFFIPRFFYAALFGVGIFLGLLAAYIGVRRFVE